MQVITLNPSEFETHARMLAEVVEEGSALPYSAIVAVRRGGSYVCDAFCRHFPKESYGARYDVALQRPSTKHKGGMLRRMLKRLPLPLLDLMRMAESGLLAMRKKMKGEPPAADVELPAGLISLLRDISHPRILVIDDAIDSGDTLFAISETLTGMNPEATVSIAVMTVTTRSPRISADYALYRNRTLIRFPWSNDYKKRTKE